MAHSYASPQDWEGVYVGPYDGVISELRVHVQEVGRKTFWLELTLDEGRQHTAVKNARTELEIHKYGKPSNPPEHTATKVIFDYVDPKEWYWPRLMIHTWDVDWLSGTIYHESDNVPFDPNLPPEGQEQYYWGFWFKRLG
jgi:hypothetical protein